MEENCPSCLEIVAFESELDRRTQDLVQRANALCADVRNRNKERWEKFASLTNLPLVGRIIYDVFRGPKELEEEPKYSTLDWYREESHAIKKGAKILEEQKGKHLDHWREERVIAGFSFDYSGYYSHFHPKNPMTREEAYQTYDFVEGVDRLIIFTPDKYDLGIPNRDNGLGEGLLVLDSTSLKLVPSTQCDRTWGSFEETTLREKIMAKLARTTMVYRLRSD